MISSLKCFQERETNVNYRRTSQMNYHVHVHYATVVDEMILWNWSYSCKFMVVKIDSWNLHADLCATCANVHRRIEEELDLSCRFLSSGLFKWLYFSKSSKRKICIFHTFVFSWGLSFSKVFCVIFSLFFLMFCIKKFLMRYLKRNGACLRLCETACLCVCVRERVRHGVCVKCVNVKAGCTDDCSYGLCFISYNIISDHQWTHFPASRLFFGTLFILVPLMWSLFNPVKSWQNMPCILFCLGLHLWGIDLLAGRVNGVAFREGGGCLCISLNWY